MDEQSQVQTPAVKKKKFHLTASIGYVLIASVVMVIGIPTALGGLYRTLTAGLTSPVGITAKLYASDILYWIIVLAVIAVFRRNRFILPRLWTGRKGNNVRMLLLGLLLGFAMNGVCVLTAALSGDIHLYFDSFDLPGLLIVFVCVFIQSSAEELIVRGYAMEKILRNHRPLTAVLSTSILFSALHLNNSGITVISFLNILLCGIFFALLCFFCDSIWCAMAAHTAWNFTQNILFGLPNSGIVVPFSLMKLEAANARDSFAYDTGFGVEGTLTALVVYSVGIVLICVLFRSKMPSLLKKPDPAE